MRKNRVQEFTFYWKTQQKSILLTCYKKSRRMKTIYTILAAFLCISMISCEQKHTITGYIKGIGNDTIYGIHTSLHPDSINRYRGDTELPSFKTVAKNGKFTIDLPLNDLQMIQLIPGKGQVLYPDGNTYWASSKTIDLYITPNEQINISGEFFPDYLSYSISGSELNSQLAEYKKTYIHLLVENTKCDMVLDSLFKEDAPQTEKNKIYNRYKKIGNEIQALKYNYIKQHPDREASAIYLSSMDTDSVPPLYNSLNPKIRNGKLKNRLNHIVSFSTQQIQTQQRHKELTTGSIAPDFLLPDTNGNQISLSSFKDKYIILDFWGSWCGYCIAEFPHLKNYYRKYHTLFEFVGVCCNDTREKWLQAIKKNDLPWKNLFCSPEMTITRDYGILAYPSQVIISPDKKIIYIGSGVNPKFYQTLDELARSARSNI